MAMRAILLAALLALSCAVTSPLRAQDSPEPAPIGEIEGLPPDPLGLALAEMEEDEQSAFTRFLDTTTQAERGTIMVVMGRLKTGFRAAFARYLVGLDSEDRTALLGMMGGLDFRQSSELGYDLASKLPEHWPVLTRFLRNAGPEIYVITKLDQEFLDLQNPQDERDRRLAPYVTVYRDFVDAWRVKTRVSRGFAAPRDFAPWQAQLYRDPAHFVPYSLKAEAAEVNDYGRKREDFERAHVCGAVLIGPGLLLTAAHCVTKPYKVLGLEAYRARTGTLNSSDGGTNWTVTGIVRHAGYDPRSMANDIALVRVAGPVREVSESDFPAIPVALPAPGAPPVAAGTPVALSGWGATGTFARKGVYKDDLGRALAPSRFLEAAHLAVLAPSACATSRAFIAAYGKAAAIIPGQLCVGSKSGASSCTGDSGGPLVRKTGPGRAVLVGIVSYSPACGHAGTPSVYVDVRAFLAWIADAKRNLVSNQLCDVPDWRRNPGAKRTCSAAIWER